MKKHNLNNLTVVKHNDLNDASYKLSFDERRLILSAVALLNPKENNLLDVKVHASEWAEQWGIDEKSAYKQLKEARTSLFERKITLRSKGRGRDIRWVYDAEYVDDEGYVILKFSPTVAPYLCQLQSHFTSYRLAEISSFKSNYTIRLYEMMMQYLSKKTNSGWYDDSVDDLRRVFGVENSYPEWFEFKRSVIVVAVKEINLKSNYTIRFETKRKGRKISRVTFFFHLNEQTDMFK